MRRVLCVMLALVATPAFAARAGFGDYVKAVRAIEEQRVEEAVVLVGELERLAPGDAEVKYLVANLAFLQGEYQRAADLLESIDDPRVHGEVAELLPLVKTTLAATRGFVSKESPGGHFIIQFAPGKDELLVNLAGEALEAAYERIGEDLGWRPPGKVRVEILPELSDLARVSTLTAKDIETSGTIALCKYNKLMIVTPRATLFGYPWLDTLAHEYTHFVIARSTSDRVPIWLHEGLAKYQESRWRAEPGADGLGRAHEHLLALALRRGKLITFEQMHPSMALLPSQEAAATAFAEVYTIVAWMQQKVGYAGIRSILGKIKDGRSERRAIAEVMGMTWDGVEVAWKRHLKGLGLKPDPAMSAQAGRLRFEKTGKGDDENVGVEQVAEEKARKLARLGGILRARGHLAGAAVEYEKARQSAPEDRFIASKLARTYLELAQPARAVEVALPLAGDRDDAGPNATLGAAYLDLGETEKARDHLILAVRISPFDPSVRCGLADAWGKLGVEEQAAREREACAQLRRGR